MKQQNLGQSKWVYTISLVLIFLLTYAGSGKLFGRNDFYIRLSLYPIIGKYAYFISWSVPTVELLLSIMLLIPALRLIGLCGSVLLLILFSGFILAMIRSGGKLPCSCGGVIEYLSWKQHIFFNLFFITIGLIAIWLETKGNRKKKYSCPEAHPVLSS